MPEALIYAASSDLNSPLKRTSTSGLLQSSAAILTQGQLPVAKQPLKEAVFENVNFERQLQLQAVVFFKSG